MVKQKVYRALKLKNSAMTKTFTKVFEKTALPRGKKSTRKAEVVG